MRKTNTATADEPETTATAQAQGKGGRAKRTSKANTAARTSKTPAAGASASGESREEDRDPESETGSAELSEEGSPESEMGAESSPASELSADEEMDLEDGIIESGADSTAAPYPSEREPVSEAATSIARFDPMAAYLREVQRHPLLTPEETHELAVRFVESQDPASAAQLVTANLRLVVKIAYEYRRAYKNIMDLVQEGNIGLMQAVKRYDPYRGVKLSSYAAWWIRAYILRFILNNWRLVKLGTTQAQRKLFFNLRKKRAELQAMGIDPTHEEIAKRLNVPESEVADMDVRLTSSEKSLDAPVGDAEGRAIAKVDMMPSGLEGPETLMADEELHALLKEKLGAFRETLAGKEKDLAIFDERLVADEPLTLQELGDRFGISRERVRQLEQRLTMRLREFLRDEMGDAAEAN
ncbi:RNA polymerase factor sigma-32 [Pendulispora brunnea]|uniref:RNA polymerase factor sigma-32 n=1 Tax=Pendulispora brunnea TaxID=2905690 RepID=A0ABZ2K4A4_9BACT